MKLTFGHLTAKWQKQDLNYVHLVLKLKNLRARQLYNKLQVCAPIASFIKQE